MTKITTVVLLLTSAMLALGQEDPSRTMPSVRVEVSAPNTELQKTVASYLNRELRSLADIRISDSGGALIVSVIVTPVIDNGGNLIAYAISTAFSAHLNAIAFNREIGPFVPDGKLQPFARWLESQNSLRGHYQDVAAATQAGIQESCRLIITTLDTDILEPIRKVRREHQVK